MNRSAGYTLIEVLVAAGLLLLVVGAAASLSLSITSQEELSARAAIALNQQEQAARLWRLGLDETAISAILPPTPMVTDLDFSETTTNYSGIGTLQLAVCTISFQLTPNAGNWNPLSWTAGSSEDQPERTNSIILLRPLVP